MISVHHNSANDFLWNKFIDSSRTEYSLSRFHGNSHNDISCVNNYRRSRHNDIPYVSNFCTKEHLDVFYVSRTECNPFGPRRTWNSDIPCVSYTIRCLI
jgi:hypothetical protein